MTLKNKRILTHCNSCEKDTYQTIIFSKRKTELISLNDDEHEREYTVYMVVQCNGCDFISFVQRHIGKVYDDGETNYLDENFPNRIYKREEQFLTDEEHTELPNTLFHLYNEVEIAFREEANILAGVGLRILVEAICIHQKIPGRNLQDKIKNLQTTGLISKAEEPILDKLRLIGNYSAHKIESLSFGKLEYALLIVNHVLRSVYILPKINKKLKIK